MIRAALIDLDGTLLDTAGDIAAAANRMLAALGRPQRSTHEISTYIGKGIARLVERSLTGDLDAKADPALLKNAFEIFVGFYEQDSGLHSAAYPGVKEGLLAFQQSNILLACVTNKAARFTHPLLDRMTLKQYFPVVVCGDEVERGKPDPACYLRACERLGVTPAEAMVIGDSDNDVLAARAAGIRVLGVPYGYNEGRPIETTRPDAVVPDLLAAARYARQCK